MSDLEKIAIRKLQLDDNRWKRYGYKKNIISALSGWLAESDEAEVGDDSIDLAHSILGAASRYLPDLYTIDHKNRLIGLLEIEDSSKLKAEKLRAYSMFWMDADSYSIDVEVYTCDRYGRNIQPLGLVAPCYDTLECEFTQRV